LPFVTGDLFQRFAMLREDFDAVVPIQSDGRPQPLCALYRQSVCLLLAAALIEEGERRPRALLGRVKTRWVNQAELDDLPGARNFFRNINAPGDYERAQALVGNDK
jgi:molybdopterin-guanine dinucleotide biosynthesis protein A